MKSNNSVLITSQLVYLCENNDRIKHYMVKHDYSWDSSCKTFGYYKNKMFLIFNNQCFNEYIIVYDCIKTKLNRNSNIQQGFVRHKHLLIYYNMCNYNMYNMYDTYDTYNIYN